MKIYFFLKFFNINDLLKCVKLPLCDWITLKQITFPKNSNGFELNLQHILLAFNLNFCSLACIRGAGDLTFNLSQIINFNLIGSVSFFENNCLPYPLHSMFGITKYFPDICHPFYHSDMYSFFIQTIEPVSIEGKGEKLFMYTYTADGLVLLDTVLSTHLTEAHKLEQRQFVVVCCVLVVCCVIVPNIYIYSPNFFYQLNDLIIQLIIYSNK
jgi:hypothetical protein